MNSSDTVYIDRVSDYDIDHLIALFRKRFEEMNIFSNLKEGMTVVIKPNLIMKSSPDSGIITHPNVTAAVGILVKETGANVLIAESSGGIFTEQSVKAVMKASGYTEIVEKYGFDIYTDCLSTQVELPEGKICRTLTVINPYVDADFVIDIAKLKTHCMTMLSGATKNLFGTVPGLMKPELHFRYPEKQDFSTMLVDLAEYIKPDLCIIDAVDALEGDGPTGGRKRHAGLMLCGKSPYSLDVCAAEVIGMKPMDVLMLEEAYSRGLCPSSSENINVLGSEIKDVRIDDFLMPRSKSVDFAAWVPGCFRPLVKKITTPRPKINTKLCVGCGKCAESCPRKAIKIENRKAHINYSDCIKCFCCHEMCPKHVIKVKRFSLFNL